MNAIKFIGDHSDVHCGCRAVKEVIIKSIPNNWYWTDDKDYDLLVVNGEGSMHHDSGPCKRKMKEISQALDEGKQVILINSVWQENSPKLTDVLRRVSHISVREHLSHDDLIRRHGVPSLVVPDLSLFAAVDFDAKRVDFSGKRVMTDFYSREFSAFVRLTDGLLRHVAYIDMKKPSWSSFVMSLKTASLLVTGRHHAVMAACKARTPFVALSGNTHKIEGFLKTSGVNIPVCTEPAELNRVIDWALANTSAYEPLFDWVDQLPPWKLPI